MRSSLHTSLSAETSLFYTLLELDLRCAAASFLLLRSAVAPFFGESRNSWTLHVLSVALIKDSLLLLPWRRRRSFFFFFSFLFYPPPLSAQRRGNLMTKQIQQRLKNLLCYFLQERRSERLIAWPADRYIDCWAGRKMNGPSTHYLVIVADGQSDALMVVYNKL